MPGVQSYEDAIFVEISTSTSRILYFRKETKNSDKVLSTLCHVFENVIATVSIVSLQPLVHAGKVLFPRLPLRMGGPDRQ